MKLQNKVICFVGPSGVGKTSFANRLAKKYSFVLPTVVTTRQKRLDDDGRYQYINETAFFEMVNSNLFIEWDKYSNYYYGTLLESVEKHRKYGIILDLTPNGCRKMIEAISSAIVIALLPDNPAWLINRLMGRNSQSQKEINIRTNLLENYLNEIDLLYCKKVYVSFSPDSWDETFKAIEKIIFKEDIYVAKS